MSLKDDELVCKNDLIHDHFFEGGGSWAIDHCPKCGGCECILVKNLGFFKRWKANRIFDIMWKEKHDRQRKDSCSS